MYWTKTSNSLPPAGEWVLVRHKQAGAYMTRYCVAMLCLGRTNEEVKRTGLIQFADQEGNNHVPYRWDCMGPGSFFGQDISHWMSIPPIEYTFLKGEIDE